MNSSKGVFRTSSSLSLRTHKPSHILLWGLAGVATAALVCTNTACGQQEEPKSQKSLSSSDPIPPLPVLEVDGQTAFSTVIIGGGTAGCTVAYLLAKWMEEQNLSGTVLLVERGKYTVK